MLDLFSFISRKRVFIIFILLEVLSFWFVFNSNNYWGVNYFNTANAITGRVLATSNSVKEYSNLREINTALATENKILNEQIARLNQEKPKNAPIAYKTDSAFASRFKYQLVAKVIDATDRHSDNYITIDKGLKDGVKVGMGVVTPNGVVGKVKYCSDEFSTITSVLHSQSLVSTKLLRSGEIGPAKWETNDPTQLSLKDISKYKTVTKGDTAVTSDYNSVFPPGVLVGYVSKVNVNKNQMDLDVIIKLSNDFSKLSFVYLIDNQLLNKQEILKDKLVEIKK